MRCIGGQDDHLDTMSIQNNFFCRIISDEPSLYLWRTKVKESIELAFLIVGILILINKNINLEKDHES